MIAGTLSVASPAFAAGTEIPPRFTGDGEDASPALTWSGVPDGVEELAVLCDDPDAPTPEPWVHWVIYGIPGDAEGLPEGIPRKAFVTGPVRATQGVNTWTSDNVGYRGPAPPPGHGTHHYHFKVFALDEPLDLPPGTDKKGLLSAMDGHVVATGELVGTYER